MIICDLPVAAPRSKRRLRAAVFGSCRVHDPINHYGDQGGGEVLTYLHPYSHTLAGAIQLLDLAEDRRRLPPELQRFVLGEEPVGAWAARMRMNKSLLGSIDVMLIETCTDAQLVLGDTALHPTYFNMVLAPAIGHAFAQWFRSVTTTGSAPADVIEAAIDQSAAKGALCPALEAILRHAHLIRYDQAEMLDQMRALKDRYRGRVILVGHLIDPADQSPAMNRRRRLTEMLKRVADRTGARVFDPSLIFAHLPRTTVLDEGGTNINEYAPSLIPAIGRALADVAGRPDWQPEAAMADALAHDQQPVRHIGAARPAAVLEKAVGDVLRQRLADMGQQESGLGAYYVHMLGRESLFTERGVSAFDYLTGHHPRGTRIAHVGASIGELPAALAGAGFKVTAHINDNRRLQAAEAIRARLEQEGLIAPGSLQLIREPLPQTGAELFVAIDAILDANKLPTEMLVAALRLHHAALIEPQNFGCRRDDEDEQMELVTALDVAGYRHAVRRVGRSLVFASRAEKFGSMQRLRRWLDLGANRHRARQRAASGG